MHAMAQDGERIVMMMRQVSAVMTVVAHAVVASRDRCIRVEPLVARVMTRVYLGMYYVMVLGCSGRFKVSTWVQCCGCNAVARARVGWWVACLMHDA